MRSDIEIYKNMIENRIDFINIIPFATIGEYITNYYKYNTNIILKFFIVNILIYLPISLFLGRSNFKKLTSILILVLLPIVLESIQQIIFKIGVFDIDAIILNVLSSIIILNITKKLTQ